MSLATFCYKEWVATDCLSILVVSKWLEIEDYR